MPLAPPARLPRFARYAWFVLAYNVATIVWGAYVRASGSGAGCGQHWPNCDGTMSKPVEMLIELAHRSTSGLAGLLVIGLAVWALRAYPSRHPVRTGALFSLGLIVSEGLVGAGLVLFKHVKDDASPMRAVWMGTHLVNTLFLLAAITLTAWSASADRPSLRLRGRASIAWTLAAPFALVLLACVAGAIAALGDTLFHATTLLEGMRDDASADAHIFLRLRALHPLFAALAAVASLAATSVLSAVRPSGAVARAALFVRVAVLAQVAVGVLNLLLLAPIPMQLVHLALADAVWIALVLLGASSLSDDAVPARAAALGAAAE